MCRSPPLEFLSRSAASVMFECGVAGWDGGGRSTVSDCGGR